MSDPKVVGLPYPFRPCEDDPYYNVEIGPKEWVRVVTGAAYDAVVLHVEDQLQATKEELHRLRIQYAALQADYDKLRRAAVEQIEAAQHLVNVWEHFGNAT